MKKILLFTLIAMLLFSACAKETTVTSVTETPVTTTKAQSEPLSIQFVRNATMKIEYAGKTFLTDPMLAEQGVYPGFLNSQVLANPTAKMPLNIDELLKNVEFTLVTHTHIPEDPSMEGPSDHFDTKAVEVLEKDTQLYIQPSDVAGLERKGFTNLNPIENTINIDNITITRLPGIHADVEMLLPLVGDSSAYVLESDGEPTIFWTGDTLLTEEMKKSIKIINPDIVIVHSGGASLPLDAEGSMSQLVMNAEDTIELANIVPNAKIVAIHLEALDHCPVTRDELRRMVQDAGMEDRFYIPNDGEALEL